LQKATSEASGGITPGEVVYPEGVTPLRGVLEATGAFPTFATDFLQRVRTVSEDFNVSNQLLDEFQQFLSERNIRPRVAEWSEAREWIRNRLKQEIFNQALGVAKGDEVEAQRDPVILRAVEVLARR
jgi:hypothetical protein